MTQLEQQMIDELAVGQGFTNDLAANLNTQGVAASNTEGLDTLVPKVLQIESGVAKSPYDEWQEGFSADWDLAVADAPLLYADRVLHVYTEVDFLQMVSYFSTSIDIVSYNPETETYRRITMDANKILTLEEADKFTNSHDGLKYVCIIYADSSFNLAIFRIKLPVVYTNSKACLSLNYDRYVNLISEYSGGTISPYQLLRGADVNELGTLNLYNGLEHLTCLNYGSNFNIMHIQGGNLAIGILSVLYSKVPTGVTVTIANDGQFFSPYISNEKLANWFYNIFIFNHYSVNYYRLQSSVVTRMFKFNSALNLTPDKDFNQIHSIPNAMYLTGTITENQSNTTYAGYHGFNLTAYTLLRNFPMWTVLSGASYGCLKPMTVYSTRGNFRFVSLNLEREYFAQFDELGELILDPTLTFVANLPIETVTGATITFDNKTFKNKFTSLEQGKIVTLVTTIKNWTLAW